MSAGRTTRMLAAACVCAAAMVAAGANAAEVEKRRLTLGFMPTADMAPLAIALDQGFFADEGLEVILESQPDWDALTNNVVGARLDGAVMPSGAPLAATIGLAGSAHLVAPMAIGRAPATITVSNDLWTGIESAAPRDAGGALARPIGAEHLAPTLRARAELGVPTLFGAVAPLSHNNYTLRFWLAAGGVHPGFYAEDDPEGASLADVETMIVPPPFMTSALGAQLIDGLSVGAPWSQAASAFGAPVIGAAEILPHRPDQVLVVSFVFSETHPKTTKALVKALIRSARWLDAAPDNRAKAAALLAQPQYVGASAETLAAALDVETNGAAPFGFAAYPYYSDAVWTLTQMRRWGQIKVAQSDAWYAAVAQRVYRPDIFLEAAGDLIADGHAADADFPWESDGYRPAARDRLEGVSFDGRAPNAYLAALKIGLKSGERVYGGRVWRD